MIGLMMFLLAVTAAIWSAARLWQDRSLTGIKKGCLFLGFLMIWFFPLLCRKTGFELPIVYTFAYHTMSFLFVWSFLFFALIVVQDAIWGVFWLVDKYKGRKEDFHWKRGLVIRRSNIILLSVSLVLSLCSLYNGLKTPELRELKIYTSKIDSNITMVALSDLHLHHSLSIERLEKIVDKVNSVNPDIIVFLGDLADEKTHNLHQHLFELSQLKAPLGKYAVSGNHEFYVGHESAKETFQEADITYLYNEGVEVAPHVYIAGIPDYRGVRRISDSVDMLKALSSAQDSDYKILLSHRPDFINTLVPKQIDLQLSGHTHGGQVFPQHLIIKFLNSYLSGLYQTENGKLYVNRGAGQWGPQMRLFAPSEITIIKLIAEAKLLENQSVVIEDDMYSDEAFISFIQAEAEETRAKQAVKEATDKAEMKAKEEPKALEPTPIEKVKEGVEEAVSAVSNSLKEEIAEIKEIVLPDDETSAEKAKPKKLLLPIQEAKPVISLSDVKKQKEKVVKGPTEKELEAKEVSFNYEEIDALIESIQKEKQEQKEAADTLKKVEKAKPVKTQPVQEEKTPAKADKTAVKTESFVRQENMFVEVSKGKDGKIYGVRIYNADHELIADTSLKEGTNVLTHTEQNADGSLITHETVLHVRSTPNAQLIERRVHTIEQPAAKPVVNETKTPAEKTAPKVSGAQVAQPVQYVQPTPALVGQRLMPVAAPIAWQPVYGVQENGMMPMYQPVMGYYTIQAQ